MSRQDKYKMTVPEGRDSYFTNGIPNPGSSEAVTKLCTCALSDNHYGLGFPMGEVIGHTIDGISIRRNVFWINGDCPIHGGMPVLDEIEEGINKT